MFNEATSKQFSFNRSDRFCWLTGEKVSTGGVFCNQLGDCENLSDVHIVHQGVDTLKAKFNGTIRQDVGHRFGLMLKDNWDPVYLLNDSSFILSPNSKASGYKYRLHAKALGVIIHVGSYHQDEDGWLMPDKGMIKFELSPHFILSLGYEKVIHTVNAFAQSLMCEFVPSGVDVHLCVDLLGWTPDVSIMEDMVTMTRRKACYHGIDDSDYDINTAAVSYGITDSFTFGRASSSQLSIYNKTKESVVKGTDSFWQDIYTSNSLAYTPEATVMRVELRLPSSVIKHLVKRSDSDEAYNILSLEILSKHLNSLWTYGLSRLFRYDYSSSKSKAKTIRPIWQLLLEDAYFNDSFQPADYKRSYIQVDDSIDINIRLALGNLTTALAKADVGIEEGVRTIQSLPIYRQLLAYMKESKGMQECHYIDYIVDVLHKKKVEYGKRSAMSTLNFKSYRRNYQQEYKDTAYSPF